jgi:drug/metabolite transporter (DMT)-like permease
LGERVSLVKWGWLFLAFGGVVILLSSELTGARQRMARRNWLAMAAAFFYALTAIIARKLIRAAAYCLYSGADRRRDAFAACQHAVIFR